MTHKENLESALHYAIQNREVYERQIGYTMDSGLVAGWRAALKELQKGNLTIKY